MAGFNIIVVLTDPLLHNWVAASRAWHLFYEVNRNGLKALLIGREAPVDSAAGDSIVGDAVMAVSPLLKKGFIGNLLFTCQISAAVLRALLTNRVSHILARGYNLAPLYLLLRLFGKKVIYDFHGFAYKEQIVEGRRLRAIITRPFDWLALTLADRILVIREELIQDLPESFRRKSLLLPNGVDLDEFAVPVDNNILAKYTLPSDKKLVGFVGNWEAWLAIEDLLKSAMYLDDRAQIVIVGAGRYFEEYKSANPSVIFTGRVPHSDAIQLLKKMDVCVCPYSSENIVKNKSARKTLEYLASGKPIIVSAVDGRERFLDEGRNILLYQLGNPKDLATQAIVLLYDEKLYADMSYNNLELAKRFSWINVINGSGLIELLRD